jgi:hypothetical protein
MESARDTDVRKGDPPAVGRAGPVESADRALGRPHPAMPGKLPAEGTTAMLSLLHAAKAFGVVQALTDGTIELRAGEAHALLGENGAGSRLWSDDRAAHPGRWWGSGRVPPLMGCPVPG